MSESKAVAKSLVTRTMGDSNSYIAELTSQKQSIWNGYLLDTWASTPKQVILSNSEVAEKTPVAQGAPDPAAGFLGRLASLSGKVQQAQGEFHRRFFASETFRGLISETDSDKFYATVSDRSGDQYGYVFTSDELPERQRKDVKVGSPVVVHVGYEYRGSTKQHVLRIFLANYEKKNTEARQKLIESKISSWDF